MNQCERAFARSLGACSSVEGLFSVPACIKSKIPASGVAFVLQNRAANAEKEAGVETKNDFRRMAGWGYGDKVTYKDPDYREWEGTGVGTVGFNGLADVKWDNPARRDGRSYLNEVAATRLRKLHS